jgi:hypothetical protein
MLSTPDDWAFVNASPVLRWIAVQGASTYTIQIATDTAFTQLLLNYPLITAGASHTPAPLTPGGTYYWRVRSVSAFGHPSEYSPYRTLLVNGAPMAGYAQSSGQTIAWGRITWAVSYEVMLATNAQFTNPQLFYRETPDIVFDGLADGTYYWRVRAIGATSVGAWSARQSFIVETP